MKKDSNWFIRRKEMLFAVVFSLILHALVAVPLKMKKKQAEEQKIRYSEPIEIMPLPIPSGNGDVDCNHNDWYGGVGMLVGFDNKVSEVLANYPAAIHGILPGDIILNEPTIGIPGDPGTEVTIEINRDGKQLTFHIKLVKICTERPV